MALGISEAVDLSGRIIELVKKGATIELQERIIELREAVLNAREELLSLRQENAELKRSTAERQHFTFDSEVYWRERDGKRDGPFCPTCYDSTAKTIRLQPLGPGFGFKWTCNVCNGAYVQA